MNTKKGEKMIIFIDGMSTTGKTTIINKLKDTLQNKKECHIFLENSTEHIMREHFNKYKEIGSGFSEEAYFNYLINEWRKNLIKCSENFYYIFDGYVLHELERTFLSNQFQWENIDKYYESLDLLLAEFNCYFLFLDREKVEDNIVKTFQYRDINWKEYKTWQLARIAQYNNINNKDISNVINFTLNKMYYIYEKFSVNKQKINTSAENWDTLVEYITCCLE